MIRKFFGTVVIVASFALLITTAGSVEAGGEWFLLGERTIKAVDQGVDIEAEGGLFKRRVKKAKVSAEQADVEITKLVFHYSMRKDDEFTNLGVVKAGGQLAPIDVPGRKAKLKSVSVMYKILGGKKTAVIKVWGFD